MLSELRAAELIYEQPVAKNAEFVFKHALTQDVAYNSLLIERRKQLHERVGQAVETLFKGQLDDHFGQLSHHYGHSDNIDEAVEYLGRAVSKRYNVLHRVMRSAVSMRRQFCCKSFRIPASVRSGNCRSSLPSVQLLSMLKAGPHPK